MVTELLERHEHSRPRGRARAVERLLRVTFACNQRCPFCFVDLTGRGAAEQELERALDELARSKAAVTISGGEPLADSRLPEILVRARRKGLRRFTVQTNGVLLARPGLLESLVRLGATSFMVSFHSHEPERYDAITGSRGQLPLARAGLARLLAEPRARVWVNVVLNALNYRGLPGLVDFLAGLGPRKPLLCLSMLNEAGHERAPGSAVDLAAAAPFIRAGLARARERGLRVERFTGESAPPACVSDLPARYAGAGPVSRARVRYAERLSADAPPVGRAKRPACRRCRYDARCLGVPARYAQLFGLSALIPVEGR